MSTKACLSDADLGRLLEHDVSAGQRQVFEQHINTCSACRQRWRQASEGAAHFEQRLREATAQAGARSDCPSDQVLDGFANRRLDADTRRTVTEHVADCPRCTDRLAETFCHDYAREGKQWRLQYIGRQIFHLLIQLSQPEIEALLQLRQSPAATAPKPQAIIKLPILEPADGDVRRLAAATGDGLSIQKLSQQNPGFAFELVQFGQQLRITATATDEDPSYGECLARLILSTEGQCLWSKIVLVENGQCRCVLEPEEIDRLPSPSGPATVRLEPLETAEALAGAGKDAYLPILTRLLSHGDPGIRCGAVQVLARLGGPQVRQLIEPLASDEDADVRSAAQQALRQWP